METLKHSRQREAIRQCLKDRMDHPTAEMLYSDLRRHDPKISLGTVYRNLSLLVQLGEIRKIPIEDGPDRFDGDTSVHGHFICRSCQCVSDLKLAGAEQVLQYARLQTEGRADEVVVSVYGVCKDCIETVTQA